MQRALTGLRMTEKRYRRLSLEDRAAISRGFVANLSFTEIALQISRPTCTVLREVTKNHGWITYQCCSADRKAQKLMGRRRGGKRKLLENRRLARYVYRGLTREWSPDEIVSRTRLGYPNVMTMCISPETIYQYNYVLQRG